MLAVQGPFDGRTQYSCTYCTKTDIPINVYEGRGRRKEVDFQPERPKAPFTDGTRKTVPKLTNYLKLGLDFKKNCEGMNATNSS